jgi:integrase
MIPEQFGELTFTEAAALWLGSRQNKLSPVTVGHYSAYMKSLGTFFGEMRLCDIHIGNINEYQRLRQEEIRTSPQHKHSKRGRPADNTDGASRINHEFSALAQIMKRGGLWDAIAKFYEPLPLPHEGPGIALTPEEEAHVFEVASSNKRWFLAYCADLLSNATATGPGEIRFLRLRDIHLDLPAFDVHERVKNGFRVRRVPCNDDAVWALQQLVDRALRLGAHLPEHFLLPHRAHAKGARPDPTRPMGSWKKAHYAIRKEAAKKFPRLATLRRYDFRHNATTKMLENPEISERTIEEFIGHRLGSKTKEKYSHIRMEARRHAAASLDSGHSLRQREPNSKRPVRRVTTSARLAKVISTSAEQKS